MQDSHCGTIYLVGRVGQAGVGWGTVGQWEVGWEREVCCQAMVSTHVCLWGVFNFVRKGSIILINANCKEL